MADLGQISQITQIVRETDWIPACLARGMTGDGLLAGRSGVFKDFFDAQVKNAGDAKGQH